jgi:hypothetical protein
MDYYSKMGKVQITPLRYNQSLDNPLKYNQTLDLVVNASFCRKNYGAIEI